MYGLIGKMKAHAGQRAALAKLLLDAAIILPDVDGCYLYVISAATDDPDALWINEVWRDKEAHDASLTNQTIRAIITSARPLIADMRGGFEVVPLGGKGIPLEG